MIDRKGFTLLEVIVALALMGSVLVGSLMAFSIHRRQLSQAEKRIQATILADRLVDELSSQQGGIPVNGRGTVPGNGNWIWQTSPLGTAAFSTATMQIVRFQIMETSPTPTRLVSVDIVVAERTP
ncbi:MAG: prepilin-type N-terminal cleavage/methylation domain-containing protein [Planctomycetales bacterium]|nr:prepilin-type N-terminal cleavage/methylation domain-containing protein [Planctomycetales bacterium]